MMALSTDINLPKTHKAVFPDRCVVCDCESPNAQVRLMTGSIGWWTWVLWFWGKPFVVLAPACSGCAWKLHGRRLLSLLVTIAIAIVAIWYIWPNLEDSVPRPLRKWAMMGIALLCLIPQFIFEAFFAKPFDITAYSDSVDYEFTSDDYAMEFARLNVDADWVKVNDVQIK